MRGDIYCEGAPPPLRILPYEYIEVIADNILLYNYNDEPIMNLPKGIFLRMESNPWCKNNQWWLSVSCLDFSCSGAVQEGDYTKTFIQNVQDFPETQSSTSNNEVEFYYPIEGCAASRLQVGVTFVLASNVDYVSIRSEPDTHPSDNKIGRINPGDEATIIGGPECSYGWIMWQIQTEAGIVGWVPESNGEEFWLIAVGN